MDETEEKEFNGIKFRTIRTGRPLFQEVMEEIETKITNGILQPGNMLPPERIMAEQFGVSRTVIREAIKALELVGLVEVQHGRGIIISKPSMESAIESMIRYIKIDKSPLWSLHEMRAIIETEIVGLAASRRTEEDVEILKSLVEQMATKVDSPEEYSEIDIEFHRALVRMTYNKLFPLVMEPLSKLMRESRRVGALALGAQKRSLESHRDIVAAIENRDAESAKHFMREHFDKVAAFIAEAESKSEVAQQV